MDDEGLTQFDRELLKQDARERNGQWRLSREISPSNVIALLVIAVTTIGVYYSLVGRVTVAEQAIVSQKYTDDRQDAEATRTNAQVQAALERINNKLDRLIERR